MKMFGFFGGRVAGEHPSGMEEALELAASQNKLVLVDIYSPF